MNKKDYENWVLKPQEVKGDYTFSSNVKNELGIEMIEFFINTIKQKVLDEKNIDYLQVFERKSDGRRVFILDQLDKDIKSRNDESWIKENDYFTVMFSEEY